MARPPVRNAWILLAFLAGTILGTHGTPSAQARAVSFEAASVSRHTAVFQIHGIRARQVRSARLVTRGSARRALNLSAVRRGAERGRLRVRLLPRERAGLSSHRRLRARAAGRKRPRVVVTTDTTPPDTTITSRPEGYGTGTNATFAFVSSESGSSFQCRIDGQSWVACSSPHSYSGLAAGAHAFAVRAIDPARNIDPTPASAEWSLASDGGGAGCQPAFGGFAAGAWPNGCWRPYADSSPFNRAVGSSPRLAPNSAAVVNRLVGWGKVQNLVAGHSGSESDYFHPLYYSQPSDPVYTVHCTMWTGACKVEGAQVRIPAQAQPAAGGDGHMAVIDQSTGVEYDFWQVKPRSADGGPLNVSHGGRTRIDGDGLGSNATAAHFGLAAGIIRGNEVLAGEINHALFASIKCSSGGSVYPAAPGTSGAACSKFGLSNEDAPPMGGRLWLDMSDAQINALPVPAWKKPVLRAMAHYGVLIGDTMAGNGSWGIQAESGASYTSFGVKDPWDTIGEQAGAGSYSGGYVFDVNSGIEWARYLRVLDPCVSAGTC